MHTSEVKRESTISKLAASMRSLSLGSLKIFKSKRTDLPKGTNSPKNTKSMSKVGLPDSQTFNNPMSPFYIKKHGDLPLLHPETTPSVLIDSPRGKLRVSESELRVALAKARRNSRRGPNGKISPYGRVTPRSQIVERMNMPNLEIFDAFNITGASENDLVESLRSEGFKRGLSPRQLTHDSCREALRKTGDFDEALDLLLEGLDENSIMRAKYPLRAKKRVWFDL